MRHLLLVATLIAVPLLAVGCSSSSPPACDTPTETTTVDMQDLRFAPACVSSTADQTLTLVNADDTPHTYTIKGTAIDVKIEGGATTQAPLTGVAPGTYAVTCLYHPQMTSTLKIT